MMAQRDPLAEAQIEDARAAPASLEVAMQEIDARIAAIADEQNAVEPPMMPQTVLRGDDHTTFRAFGDVCARIEAHQKTGAALMDEYKALLARLSTVAAKAGSR